MSSETGPLTISWFKGPKGSAVEAKNGIGVGFFSDDGTLLCVEFDDVEETKDHQELVFDRYRVSVDVNHGKITHALAPLAAPKKGSRSSKKPRREVNLQ